MIIMKQILILAVIIFIVSCSGKARPKDMELGIALADRAVNYTLQGQQKMAAFTYNRAVAKFRDMGRFCDMSRVAITHFTIDNFTNKSALDDAKAFAILGECLEEINVVGFLTDKPYVMNKLPEPYKTFAEYKKTGNISYLKSLASSQDASEKIKSLTYRRIAEALLDKDPKEAIKYIQNAKLIDQKLAWTRNLINDEKIMLEALKKLGMPTGIVEERIKIFEQAIREKY